MLQLSLSFIPSADPPSDSSTTGRSPTTLAFSFMPDYRLDISVRSLVGSRARLQDVPKIAQIVEARIYQWFDERCVEPRVQQIILPSLWPRKKNTRGGEEDEEDETAVDDSEDMADEFVSKANGKGDEREEATTGSTRGRESMNNVSNDDSLEARMAATGRAIREAEAKERGQKLKDDLPTIRKRPGYRSVASTDALKMPGHFD